MIEYPEAKIRDYIYDTLFVSFLGLNKYTVTWLEEAFAKVPEIILPRSEQQIVLLKMKEIDVSNAEYNKKDAEKYEKWKEACSKFQEIFDSLDSRSKHLLYRI